MPFIGELIVKQLPVKIIKKKLFKIFSFKKTILEWEVYEDFSYKNENLDIIITVPKGFKTDFASVPRIFWNILPPIGKYNQAAVIHDYLYRTGKLPRKEVDKIFLTAMKELSVSWWKRQLMYYGVRLFGWIR